MELLDLGRAGASEIIPADAAAIKYYNGCRNSYLGYDPGAHTWWFSSWAAKSGYPGYVSKVLSQILQQ